MDRLEFKFASEGVDVKTGEFAGYGAVFGNIDSHGDVIVPGAFKDTLADWQRRGALPAMKLMHGSAANPFNGSDLPIGRWLEMREDHKGLFVKGKLSGLDTDRGRYTHALMQDGALGALSIGFKAVRASRGAMPQVKRQIEVVRLFEVSLVPEGSNPEALVTSIKSADEMLTIRDFEEALARGTLPALSLKEAKALLAGGFKAIRSERDAGEVSDELAESLRRNIHRLQPE